MENKLRRGLALLMTLIMLISCAPMDALAAIVPVSGGTQTSSGVSLKSIVKPPVATHTYIFMNGDTEFARQIVKGGESLNNPGTPDSGSPNKEFTGWRDGDNNAPVFGAVTVTDTKTITYHAQFADVYFVFFTNEKGEVMVTKKGANGDTISTDGVTYPVGNEQSIVGWKDASGNLVSSVTLNGRDVTLTAKVENGHWITYDSQGGTYVAPAFVKGNGTTTAPAAPTRPGYTFRHWSAAVGGAAFTFGQPLDQALTLHAVWTANTDTRYTVIHWQENADDDEYSYAESETKTGATGAQTSAAAKSYTGFTVQTIAQQTIAGDGSTIVNVYYKRNTYTLTFRELTCERWHTHRDSCYKVRKTITAKYQADIHGNFPIKDGTETIWWTVPDNCQSFVSGNYLGSIDTMPAENITFSKKASESGAKLYYYVETLDGAAGDIAYNGKNYKLYKEIDLEYSTSTSLTYAEEFHPITGFTQGDSDPYLPVNGKVRMNRNNYLYYTRNSYNIVYVSGGEKVNTASKKFEQSIADAGSYTPPVKPVGQEDYVFGGWYADEATTKPYDFTGKTMPAQNVTVYAKWNKPVYNGTIYLTIEGTTGSSITLNVPKGDTIETALNEKQAEIMGQVGEGYTWRGWRTGKDGTGEPFNPQTRITTDVTLYPYYTKDGTFTVEYVSGKNDVTAPVDGKSYAEDSFADLMSPGKLVADDGEYFLGWSDGAATYQPRDKYQIKSNHANERNVITLTARWGARPAGTTLTYKANGGVGADEVENLANNATVTTIANPFSRVGYTFKGWDTNPKGEGSIAPDTQVQVDNNGANVLYAIWTANTDTKYTVEFYYEDANGNYTLNHKDETRTATTDTRVEVTDDDKAAKENGKYVFDEHNANNVLSGNVAGDGSLVLKLYFKLNTASYTIHHYLNGTTVKVADDQTGAKTIGETLTAKKSDALYAAYAAAVVAVYAPSQTITIAADESKNVITVYYTMPLTITAKDANKTYDGQPLTQPDFKMEGLVNGDTKGDFSLSMTASSTITNAGNTPNVIDESTVKYKNGDIPSIPSYYNVSYKPGTLTVKKASATVTITGVKETAVYDSKEHEANGYNYSFTGKQNEITISLKPNVLAIARRTDVGTTYMGLTKDSFTVTSANYDVTINAVIDGYVTITPVTDKVTVTVTENGAIVTYDGNEHSVKGYKSMTADNKLYDVTTSVKTTETAAWTATGTDAGEYPVGVAAGDFENINKNFTNVAFVIVDGVLKINPITENTITITANSETKVYDGTPLTDGGFTFTQGVLVKGDVLTAVVEGSQTDAGSSGNTVTSYKVMRGDKDVTGNYTFGESVKGTLTVNKRPVTIIAQDNKKEYDGQSHGKNPDTAYVVKAAAENSGLVSGHTESNVNIAFTAVDAGTYAGKLAIDKTAVTIVDSNNKNVTGNYAIELEPGTLTIEQHKGEVIVTIKGNTQQFTYDCTKHTVQGFTATVNNSLYNVNTDFKYDGNLYEAATLLAVAEGTNVGVYHMNLLSNHCVNLNKNFANVTFRVQDGSLAIERQYLAIEVDNSSKVYGAADPAFADATLRFYNKTGEIIKPSAEMMQDVSTIDLTVHRADHGDDTIGTHVDVLTISKTAEELNKIYTNYEIGVDKGDFEITSTEESLKVRADNYEGAYDGDGHGVVAKAYVNGTDEEPKAVIRYYNEGTGKFDLTESPKFIDVKSDTPGERTYTVRFQATLDGLTAEGSANVLIAPRKLVLSSGTESKDYDGLPLTSQEVVIEEGSIIKGQIYDLKATGSVTTVAKGMVENTITYSTTDEFKPVNYEIEQKPGMLHIEKRDVILTSETASKEYDGTPLTRENVTVERNGFVDGEVTDLRATGSVTYVDQGEVTNTITFTPTDKFDENNYSIIKQEGRLSITKREGEGKTITVTANSGEKVYDGTPLTNNGFTHTGVLVDGDVLTAVVEGSATNVGDEGKNVVKSYVVKRGETDVTKNYTFGNSIDGKLTINPRKVTLTSETASKEYDGKPLTKPVVTVTGDGFVTGEGATYTFTGSQTVVGSSANAFTYTLNEGTNAGNYEVAKTEGMLTVTQNEKAIKVTANSHTWEYDGQAHSDGGYTVEYDGQTYKVEAGKTVTLPTGDIVKAKITKTVTNVSDSAPNNNTIDELTIVNAAGEDTKGQYKTIPLIPGTLTITKRGAGEEKVKITAADNTVEYDGQPHGAKLNAANQIEVGTSFTVTNLADGHSVKTLAIDGSETDAGVYANKLVPGNAVIVDGNGVEVTANYDITYVPGTLTITQRGSGDMKVVLTAANNTVVYDGQPHGAKLNAAGEIEAGTSYTITNLADGHKAQSVVISGSETAVGEYENRLVPSGAKIVDAAGNDVTRNYVVGYENGKLTITSPDTVIVTIKGKTDTVEYDGQKHEVNGYEVVSISNTLYTEADFGFADGATAHAEGTDAGDYFMNLTKDSFVNKNGNFTSVTFVVEDGKLTITRRGLDEENLVKIIAADNTVYYDGQPHGAKLNAAGQIEVNVSYTTEYLAPGHKVQSVVIDGSRTKVGLYKDELVPKSAVIVDKTDKDVTENYEITYVPGTLEIRKNETEIKVTANSHTWEYDGQAHSDGGYTVTYGNESYTVKAGESATLSTGDKVTAVVKGQVKDVDDTKAGNNEIVEWSVEHRDFYNNVTPANGTLTITPRKVTLKSDGGSKPYDGTPLTKPEVAVTGDGFVAGEVTGITATGSVTYVSQGEVDNLITFTKNEGFKDSNYEIEEIIGKLSIEALDVTIIITGPSAIREYKPGVTHTIVTGGSELDFVYGSDKVDGKIGVKGMVKGDKILPGTLKHTLEGMYVGEYEGVFTLFDSNGKKADKPTVMHDGVDVTENYKFSYNPGKLTITGKHMDGDKEVENEVPEKNYLLGQKIPFTITVRSVSKDELKDVTVTDPTATILPDRNTANPAYTVSEDEHTATITSLAPEAEVIVYAEHEVTEDDIINRYTNEATINWGDDVVEVSKTPSIEEKNPEAELVKEIVLQDGLDENHKFKLGETVYFKITVTNTGNVTLNEYEVKEVLPGAAFIDGTGYTLNNDKTVATIEKMEPVKDGQEAPDSNQIVLYAQYTIKEEDLGNKELKNIVTADNSKPGEVPIPVDEAKSVSGQKIWKDEGNAFNTRPASITLTLMRKLGQNGAAEQYRTMQLGSNGSWRYSFDHLPKHDAQENEYFYWVVEEPVTGYDTAYETKDESHCDIVNNLQTYTLTIHYWQHKLGDTKMEQAFPDYVATLYYKQPYDVESPEHEGIILDDMSQARISGTMPAHDLVIDVYYHRIAYRLTIHYIYQDGTMAHEDYTWTYWFNSTYNVPSPIIPGFTPSIDVIAGRMPSHGLELTVVYVGDGEIVIPDEDTSLGFKSYLNAGECFE